MLRLRWPAIRTGLVPARRQALPGNSEYWDRQTVYIYESEGAAGALRWDQDTGRLQIYLGAARSILPRIQSMEANFVTINAESAKPVPWKNRALNQEKLSRMLVKGLFYAGGAVAGRRFRCWSGSVLIRSPTISRPSSTRRRS